MESSTSGCGALAAEAILVFDLILLVAVLLLLLRGNKTRGRGRVRRERALITHSVDEPILILCPVALLRCFNNDKSG